MTRTRRKARWPVRLRKIDVTTTEQTAPRPLCVPDTEAAEMFRMGRSTFRENVSKGVLPKPIKLGGLTRWRVADLEAYVNNLNQTGRDGRALGRTERRGARAAGDAGAAERGDPDRRRGGRALQAAA